MALFKSRGIVFRNFKYGESSLIVDIYTREKGLRSFIVSGVRKSKSSMGAALFQHGNIVDVIAYDKPGKLARLKEIRIYQPYKSIHGSIEKSSILLFMLEISRNAIKEEEANIPMYEFLESRFRILDGWNESTANIPLKFMLDFAAIIGFEPANNYKNGYRFHLESGRFLENPDLEKHVLTPVDSKYIHLLINVEFRKIRDVEIPKQSRNKLLDELINFFRLHLDPFNEPLSLSIFRQVF